MIGVACMAMELRTGEIVLSAGDLDQFREMDTESVCARMEVRIELSYWLSGGSHAHIYS